MQFTIAFSWNGLDPNDDKSFYFCGTGQLTKTKSSFWNANKRFGVIYDLLQTFCTVLMYHGTVVTTVPIVQRKLGLF